MSTYKVGLPRVILFLVWLWYRRGSLSSIQHCIYHTDMDRPDDYRIHYTLPKE